MSLLTDSYISFLNLEKRTDRLAHMSKELARIGVQAKRTAGRLPHTFDLNDPKLRVMRDRTAGAIGCHYGQVEIMQKALELDKHAFVMEDDLLFCDSFQERMAMAEKFLEGKNWHIFWLSGTYHVNPAWWHKEGHSPDLQMCNCKLGVDAEKTEDKHFVRTYGAFSTHCYIVNKHFLASLLDFLEENIHLSMGIDWLMILLQPMINAYAPVPGMCVQLDNMSDIGMGMSTFSGFKMLGSHWFAKSIEDFDYENFKI